jgi:hypothetical protein
VNRLPADAQPLADPRQGPASRPQPLDLLPSPGNLPWFPPAPLGDAPGLPEEPEKRASARQAAVALAQVLVDGEPPDVLACNDRGRIASRPVPRLPVVGVCPRKDLLDRQARPVQAAARPTLGLEEPRQRYAAWQPSIASLQGAIHLLPGFAGRTTYDRRRRGPRPAAGAPVVRIGSFEDHGNGQFRATHPDSPPAQQAHSLGLIARAAPGSRPPFKVTPGGVDATENANTLPFGSSP